MLTWSTQRYIFQQQHNFQVSWSGCTLHSCLGQADGTVTSAGPWLPDLLVGLAL